jgi:hypothetical protein
MAKHRAFQKHKEWAYHATLEVFPRHWKWGGAPIMPRYVITPKGATRRAIDRDNVIAAMKAYQDGIALALNVDDSAFAVPEVEFAKAFGQGKVGVTLL